MITMMKTVLSNLILRLVTVCFVLDLSLYQAVGWLPLSVCTGLHCCVMEGGQIKCS